MYRKEGDQAISALVSVFERKKEKTKTNNSNPKSAFRQQPFRKFNFLYVIYLINAHTHTHTYNVVVEDETRKLYIGKTVFIINFVVILTITDFTQNAQPTNLIIYFIYYSISLLVPCIVREWYVQRQWCYRTMMVRARDAQPSPLV